jgi:hypothetical protein
MIWMITGGERHDLLPFAAFGAIIFHVKVTPWPSKQAICRWRWRRSRPANPLALIALVAAAAPDLDALALLPGEDAEAVVCHLMHPSWSCGRVGDQRRLARADEPRRRAPPPGRGRGAPGNVAQRRLPLNGVTIISPSPVAECASGITLSRGWTMPSTSAASRSIASRFSSA